MTAFELKRIAWWEDLSPVWKNIFIRNLGLEGYFELKDLRYLNALDELDCRDTDIKTLKPLLKFPQLKILKLCDTQVRDFELLKYLPELQNLDLSFCSHINLRFLKPLRKLELLDISYPASPILHPELLAEMAGLRYLKANACKDISLLKLAKHSRLEYISMKFCYVGEMEVHMFESLKPNCELLV